MLVKEAMRQVTDTMSCESQKDVAIGADDRPGWTMRFIRAVEDYIYIYIYVHNYVYIRNYI